MLVGSCFVINRASRRPAYMQQWSNRYCVFWPCGHDIRTLQVTVSNSQGGGNLDTMINNTSKYVSLGLQTSLSEIQYIDTSSRYIDSSLRSGCG